MKKIFCIAISILTLSLMMIGCAQDPAADQTVEISVATFNDNVLKFVIDINSGLIDTVGFKNIAGDSTGIKVPIDIETNRVNKLFVLSQGNSSFSPHVSIFSDTANGNIRPETAVDVNAGTDLKPIGRAIAEGTDFIFVSYFPVTSAAQPKVIRFSIRDGSKTTFDINAQSIGDIELLPSATTIFAVDPLGKQIIQLRINSSFEVQPGFSAIQGTNTGMQNPNSIALTTDGTIHVFDRLPGSDEGRVLIFDAGAAGNASPARVLWNRCPGKNLIAPYGLAVTEYVGAKVILTCSGNSMTTFLASSSGCSDFLQRFTVSSPSAVAFDKVRF